MTPDQRILKLEQQIAQLTTLLLNHRHRGSEIDRSKQIDLSKVTVQGLYEIIAGSVLFSLTNDFSVNADGETILNSGGDASMIAGLNGPADIFLGFNTETATTATKGFLNIPTCNGIPTGVPDSLATGFIPVIFDRLGFRLYAYQGGWVPLT